MNYRPQIAFIANPALPVVHKSVVVDGIRIFYREAGPRDAPVILLLHGFPSSSRMFVNLFPLLSSKYRLIAPDYPGFGQSDAPSPEEFLYTFDHLSDCMEKFLAEINIPQYTLYLQDYGGPVGFRLAVAHPERVTALIIQNAVVHIEGLSDSWTFRKAFWTDRAAHEEKMRESLLSRDVAQQRHLAGVSQTELIDPDTWSDEFTFLTRPGVADIQIDLMFDYQTNVAAYPRWQAYLREKRPPILVVWGKYDPLFTVAGAMAFCREAPDAEIHLLNASHFALDEEAETIAMLIHCFMNKRFSLEY
jgi:pimeloyl-ACP methyl ester carboxylesterase